MSEERIKTDREPEQEGLTPEQLAQVTGGALEQSQKHVESSAK